ncbi:MAG: peptide chain release factor 2 [Parcubacteria group bacterium]|jgi:peptide chain release factor 2
MQEILKKIEELKIKLPTIRDYLDINRKTQKITELTQKSEGEGFWNDSQNAGKIMQEIEELKKEISEIEEIENKLKNLEELVEISESEPASSADKNEIEKEIFEIEKNINALEFKTLFSEEYDRNDAIINIMSGAGGVDAQDWSEMLLRMYLKWAQINNFKARLLDETRGQEAGIKSATLEISGSFAYGYLKSEAGVHRLVRLSPFNADNLRQTSFALVEIMPVISEMKEVLINPQDLRIDVYRSSGAGGQSVNTTDSAVRITHIPTGVVSACQNERSQLQNKEQAMKILRAKLHKKYLEEVEEEKRKLRGESLSAEWGSQIRSYVIHPYKMVKDHRTKHETAQAESVLEGNLNEFMESYLKYLKK